jgi:glutathione S-transferase
MPSTPVLKIYHVPLTRSVRIVWLCEALELPYEKVPVDFSPAYRASPEWRKMNPVGKVPVLNDGDLTMFESGAMVQYILDRYGAGRLQPPAGTHAYAKFLQWCWFAEATHARPLGEIVNHNRVLAESDRSAVVVTEMQERSRACVQALDDELAEHSFIVDDAFSAADIMVGYTLLLAERFAPQVFPANIKRYRALLKTTPGYTVATADITMPPAPPPELQNT